MAQADTPAYVMLDGSFLIDSPVEKVWPLAIEYTSWQAYSSADPVSGPPGAVREVVRLKKEEPGLESFPDYYARTLKIEANRRIVWKTWPASRDEGGADFWGIVDFRLLPEGERTRFVYNVYYEFALEGKDEDELVAFEAQMTAGFEQMMGSVFPKLKSLAEAR